MPEAASPASIKSSSDFRVGTPPVRFCDRPHTMTERPRPSGRKHPWARHLIGVATKTGEKCGLSRQRAFCLGQYSEPLNELGVLLALDLVSDIGQSLGILLGSAAEGCRHFVERLLEVS